MKFAITGIPKSGNHALKKACRMLKHDMDVGHLTYEERKPDHTYICIVRDPRNVLLSWMRFVEKPITLPWIKESLLSPVFQHTLLEWHIKCLPWLSDPVVKVIRFEDLLASSTGIKKLANYLGEKCPPHAFKIVTSGGTATFNKRHSDWKEIWTSEIEETWNAAGGEWMLANYNYTPWRP